MAKRTDYGNTADAWFASLDEDIAALAAELRALIQKAAPRAAECIKWGAPVYENGGLVCSLRKGTGYVALQFGPIGTSLKDPDGLLEGAGKNMRHVKIHSKANIKKQRFTSWIKQAAKANFK